jgi:methionyl-tRNA synthetase
LNAQREAGGWLKRGLQARAITRDTAWGVTIPLADPEAQGKRLYVWFDAPIGYVTFTQQLFAREGNPDGWKEFWQNPECPVVNFIGKDNIPFHAITWPAMLIGANENVPPGERPYQLVSHVVANEFLKFGEDKFSKSRGNIIEIDGFVQKYGSQPLRYYLNAVAPENSDSTFTWEDFLQRYNGELADVLGNYVHRVLTFAVNKLGGKVPLVVTTSVVQDVGSKSTGGTTEVVTTNGTPAAGHQDFSAETAAAQTSVGELLDAFQFRNAQAEIIACARAGNVHFDAHAPWKSLKTNPEECNKLVHAHLCRVCALGLMLRPFLPESAAAILGNFGVSKEDAFKPETAAWRADEIVKPGLALGKPEVLFKKLEAKDLPGGQ